MKKGDIISHDEHSEEISTMTYYNQLRKHIEKDQIEKLAFLRIAIGVQYLERVNIFKKHSTHSRIFMVRKLILQT